MTIATQQDHTYQFFPPLSDEEYTALKKDIEDRGIQVPIELDSDGNILDGHHRWAIAQELSIPEEKIPTVVRTELTTEREKIAHVLKVNLLRRKSVSPLTQAKCILVLKEARGIDTATNHNRHTSRTDTLTALWEELGLNPRSGRRYLQWYDELKDAPEVCQQVEAGEITITQARREVGALIRGPLKKKLLFDAKGGKGATGFLQDVQEYVKKHIAQFKEQEALSIGEIEEKDGQVVLTISIKV
jgi:hypothetical protein